MPKQNIDHAITIQPAGSTQHGFVTGIVQQGTEPEGEGVTLQAPAGKGTGGFTDILFGITTQAQCGLAGLAQHKQFHHLACKILVRGFLAAVGTVQVGQHGRVFGNRMQQACKRTQGLAAQQLVLVPHGHRPHHLLLRCGKVVVPEQGQALLQGRVRFQHFTQPPGFDVQAFAHLQLARGHAFFLRGKALNRRWQRLRHKGRGRVFRFSSLRKVYRGIDDLLRVFTHQCINLRLAGCKTGAHQKVAGFFCVQYLGDGVGCCLDQADPQHQRNPPSPVTTVAPGKKFHRCNATQGQGKWMTGFASRPCFWAQLWSSACGVNPVKLRNMFRFVIKESGVVTLVQSWEYFTQVCILPL